MANDKLKSEIENDPLSRGYSGMTDAEVVESLVAEDRTVYKPISSAALLAWSAASGRLSKLRSAITDGPDDASRSLAEAAYILINRDGTDLNLALTDRMDMLNGLVAYSILSEDDKTSLLAIAQHSVSRASEIGLGRVRQGTVARARNN